MPKYLDELRQRQAFEAKPASSVPIAIAVIFAFGFGAVAATGLVKLPSILSKGKPAKTVTAETAAVETRTAPVAGADTGAPRLGSASRANILLSCVPRQKLGLTGNSRSGQIDPADIYRVLQFGSRVTRLASVAGAQQDAAAGTALTTLWADVADCAMAQNGWTLCDPDNRALAVEAATNLVQQVKSAAVTRGESGFETVTSKPGGRRGPSRDYLLQAASATRDRVLANLRMRVQEGRFIASDFGFFAPGEISSIFSETTATRDACAEKR